MPQKVTMIAPTKTLTTEDVERIRQSILEVSTAGRRLLNGGLNKRAIVTLIADETELPRKDIAAVLDCAANLDKLYLTK